MEHFNSGFVHSEFFFKQHIFKVFSESIILIIFLLKETKAFLNYLLKQQTCFQHIVLLKEAVVETEHVIFLLNYDKFHLQVVFLISEDEGRFHLPLLLSRFSYRS